MRHLLLSLSCLFGIVSGDIHKRNYHLPSEKFYFIDEQDGDQAKVLSNADEVNIIKFGARVL